VVKFKYFEGILTNLTAFVKKLRTQLAHGMPATTRPAIFALPFCFMKMTRLNAGRFIMFSVITNIIARNSKDLP
jgi:hypothetical protein